jgi:hypothetical protein
MKFGSWIPWVRRNDRLRFLFKKLEAKAEGLLNEALAP